MSLEKAGPLEFDRPMVVMAQSAQSADGKPAAPIAYVVRYVFDQPGPQSNPPAGDSVEKEQDPRAGTATTNGLVTEFSVSNVPARFQATIYQLDAMPVRVDTLDAAALAARATTDETLLQLLAENGKARLLHHIDKLVNACSEQIQISTNQDMVSHAQPSPDGRMLPSSTQTRTGVLVGLSSQMIPKGRPGEGPAVTTSVQFSCLTPSELDLAPGVPATSTRTLAMEDTEPLRFNQPRVFVAARSIYAREQEAPVVYIIRYLFSPPTGP